jgi:hypothetical protein
VLTSISGLRVQRGTAARLRDEHQPVTGAGRRVGDPGDAIDAGGTRHVAFQRRQMQHHVGAVGQLLQRRIVKRRADEIDRGVQALMWPVRDRADPAPGRHQLTRDGPPDQSGDVGNQDPHRRHLPNWIARQ